MKSNAKQAPATRPAATPMAGRLGALAGLAALAGLVALARSAALAGSVGLAGVAGSSAACSSDLKLAEAALADTATMAGSASTIPVRARAVGRSPSSSPASTENPAAPTALIGPATLNAAWRNPRYSASAPAVPPRPATAPQARAAVLGG